MPHVIESDCIVHPSYPPLSPDQEKFISPIRLLTAILPLHMPSPSPHRLVPVFSSEAIESALESMARQIDEELGSSPYIALGLLDGAKPMLSSLREKLRSQPEFREVKASSYSGTSTTGTITCDEQWGHIPPGITILIIDDVVDTGITVAHIKKSLLACGAGRVLLAVTVDKPTRRSKAVSPDFYGFRMEDRFIVGFGMDYDGLYRELPHIAAVEFE